MMIVPIIHKAETVCQYPCRGIDALTGEPEKSKMTDRKHKERNRYFPDGKIVLYGISMGADTVMQASGLPLPESVVGIVEDCGFTSAYEEFRHMLKSMAHLPGFPLLNILGWQCKRFLKLDIKANDSRKCVAATKLPMLFLHGDADAFVPAAMAKECCAACAGDKRLVVFEGAAHAQSHFRHPEQYEREFFAFVEHVTSSASC